MRRWGLEVGALLVGMTSSLPAQAPDPARVAQLRRDFPCSPNLRGRVMNDSATREVACHAVAAAVREVARGKGQMFGIAAADSAHIAGAFVDAMGIQALHTDGGRDPANDEVYWFVELVFTSTPRRLYAWVDARADRITMGRGVAEFGELRRLPWIH